MRIRSFLEKGEVGGVQDVKTQFELWAYMVAKHYSISLQEVYSMSPEMFKQSIVWAGVMTQIQGEEQEKRMQEMKQKTKSNGNESVSIDHYKNFLDME